MNRRILTRLLILCVVAAGSIYLIASRGLRMGLDLSGGVQIALRVLTDDAINADTDRTIETIRQELAKRSGTPAAVTRLGSDHFQVKPASDPVKALAPEWTVEPVSERGVASYRMRMQASRQRELREHATIQTMRVLQNRLDGLGVGEITIQRSGSSSDYEIHLQVPGSGEPDRIKQIIQATALLELKLVERGPFESSEAATASYNGNLPQDVEILRESVDGQSGPQRAAYYVVRQAAAVSGLDLKTASASRDRLGRPAVAFTLTADASQRFAGMTEQNVGRGLAIVLDGVIQSVPEISTRIAGDGIIEGGRNGFTADQARDLALILRSGALPARTEYTAEELVGPSLGSDSVRAGIAASVVAIGAVTTFMIAHYRAAGVNATFAMLLNLLLLLGMMASVRAALTVPGIAGIVLTIGVGIDSNVLVFERIREELRAGKPASSAVSAGFQRVFRTLIDTHLAAMISAAILFMFGTGAVRGFAVTLAIGLLSNLFTSVFVSRTLFEWVLRRRRSLSI